MDLHELDVRINVAGISTSAMHEAAVALDLTDAKVMALVRVIEQHGAELAAIQAWSNDARKPAPTLYRGLPVTRNDDGTLSWNGNQYASEVDITVGKPIVVVAEKLPRLEGDTLARLLHEVKTAQHDAGLDTVLGDNHNAYKNAYSVGGYYYDPRV